MDVINAFNGPTKQEPSINTPYDKFHLKTSTNSEEKSEVELLKEKLSYKKKELEKLEHVLLANLAHKEQEITELATQVEDLKANQNPCKQQLRCMGLDPAVNVVFLRIKKEMKECKEKLEQTQNDLQAWKFTPDSQNGKRMMSRIRVLLQENEELGKINQSGRTAKLESEIAMRRTLIEELKRTNSDLETVIEEMDSETECFQSTIMIMQQQLVLATETIEKLSIDLDSRCPGRSKEILATCNWSPVMSAMNNLESNTTTHLNSTGNHFVHMETSGSPAKLFRSEDVSQTGIENQPICTGADVAAVRTSEIQDINMVCDQDISGCEDGGRTSVTCAFESKDCVQNDIDGKLTGDHIMVCDVDTVAEQNMHTERTTTSATLCNQTICSPITVDSNHCRTTASLSTDITSNNMVLTSNDSQTNCNEPSTGDINEDAHPTPTKRKSARLNSALTTSTNKGPSRRTAAASAMAKST